MVILPSLCYTNCDVVFSYYIPMWSVLHAVLVDCARDTLDPVLTHARWIHRKHIYDHILDLDLDLESSRQSPQGYHSEGTSMIANMLSFPRDAMILNYSRE